MRRYAALIVLPALLAACAGAPKPGPMPPAPKRTEVPMLTLRDLAVPRTIAETEDLLDRLGGQPIRTEGVEIKGLVARMKVMLHAPVDAVVEPIVTGDTARGVTLTLHGSDDPKALYAEISEWLTSWIGKPEYVRNETTSSGLTRTVSFWGLKSDVVYVARVWLRLESVSDGTAVRLIYRTEDAPTPPATEG